MLANKTNDNRTYQPCREGKGSCKTLTATAAALKGWGGHVAAPLRWLKTRVFDCSSQKPAFFSLRSASGRL